ncbi:MAG: hypothetical protein JWM62_2192 [Frankiales bacterium]|nr:hypothetical protein [Frankiales bacterium]
MPDTRRRGRGLPTLSGTLTVAPGLLVLGATTYLFLVVAGRAMGAVEFGRLSVLYTAVYVLGVGFFYPLEQQVSRLVAGRVARGEGCGPLLLRSSQLAGGLLLVLIGALTLTSSVLADELFGGELSLVLVCGAAVVTFAATYLVRGALAGTRRLSAYSTQLALEGVLRLLGAGALVALDLAGPLSFGILIAASPLVATLCVARAPGLLVQPGPAAPWREVGGSFGLLLVGGAAAQALANAGPLLVALLSGPAEQAQAGVFLAALVLVRIPMFLFAAVQASLVPDIAAAAAAREWDRVVSAVRALALLVLCLGGATVAVLAAVGPLLVRLLFGEGFVLDRMDMVLLSAGCFAYLLAQVFNQALVALGRLGAGLLGWCCGLVLLAAGTAAVDDLQRRVEVGLLAGSLAAAAAMMVLLLRVLRAPRETEPEVTAC